MRVGSPPSIQLKQPPTHRLSFASSSFKDRGTSPLRKSQDQPHNLSPDELVLLARPNTMASPPMSPTFTVLPEDILLPFIDRPSEVQTLIASPPSAKLFALLQLTFNQTHANASSHGVPEDPALWSYAQLYDWLVKTDRDAVPDDVWIAKVRTCVLGHSELIWERLKGALGVPPEFDLDDPTSYDDDVNTSDLEDGGKKARGHWDDWDAVMDSPDLGRGLKGPGSPLVERLSPLPPSTFGPDGPSSPLVIEPILASPSHSPFFPAGAGASPSPNHGLGGILEEEESSANNTATANTPETDDMVKPSQIHGLVISTNPLPFPPVRSPSDSPLSTRRPSFEHGRRPSFGTGSPLHSPHLTGRRSRPSSISSFSSMSLGAYPMSSSEERSSPLFPSSFAMLKTKTAVK